MQEELNAETNQTSHLPSINYLFVCFEGCLWFEPHGMCLSGREHHMVIWRR